jgi:hypothetical protein
VVHAAADDVEVGSSIHHISNAAGEWRFNRLLEGHATAETATAFWAPTIGQDVDGQLSIAFHSVDGRYPDDLGLWYQAAPTYLISGQLGDWSPPIEIGHGDAPSVVVRDGAVHFAAQKSYEGDPALVCGGRRQFPLTYRTSVSGSWTSREVTGNGVSPQLALTAEGLPRILYSGHNYRCATGSTIGRNLLYATAARPTGRFRLEELPGTPYDEAIALAFDVAGRPHVLFARADRRASEFGEVWYGSRDDGEWSRYRLALDRARPLRAVLHDGFFHVLARTRTGIVHATNRGGRWHSTVLWSSSADSWDASVALDVDGDGRPHVLLSTEVSRNGSRVHELWYTVGPGR